MAAVALALAAPPATAQSLQHLTVESFVLSADTSAPQVDQPFHVIVTLHVRQRVTRIDNLDLPLLAQLELLGDERETRAGRQGTQYRETITVVAHQPGLITVAPATLEAVDARDGKPKEWYTNELRLRVGGPPLLARGIASLRGLLRVALWVVVCAAGLLLLAGLVVLFVRRRPQAGPIVPPAAPPPEPPPIAVRTRRQQIEDALAVLRAERTRGAAVRVRAAVWGMLGASEGETLGDVLHRPAATDPAMRRLLIALERSAFTYDDDLEGAVSDACTALQEYAESLA